MLEGIQGEPEPVADETLAGLTDLAARLQAACLGRSLTVATA